MLKVRCFSMFLCASLVAVVSAAHVAVATAESNLIQVDYSVELAHGDWIPIEPEDMERAAVDAAFARLSDEARLRVGTRLDSAKGADASVGHLGFSLSLIGRAETLQCTMRLDTPGAPTAVATTEVSLAGLDHRGIYEAFKHAGQTTAERLIPNLPDPSAQAAAPQIAGSKEAKALYDKAQQAKRARRFSDALALFAEVASLEGAASASIAKLARDELRYGLPAFEAQQLLNDVAGVMGPPAGGERNALMARAEHLYRQIEAENEGQPARVAEAQRAIDQLLVMRRALANAMRASSLSKASGVRMYLTEAVMMEGECPEAAAVEQMLSQMRGGLVLGVLQRSASGATSYVLEDPQTGALVELDCDRDGVRFASPKPGGGSRPAAPESRR